MNTKEMIAMAIIFTIPIIIAIYNTITNVIFRKKEVNL